MASGLASGPPAPVRRPSQRPHPSSPSGAIWNLQWAGDPGRPGLCPPSLELPGQWGRVGSSETRGASFPSSLKLPPHTPICFGPLPPSQTLCPLGWTLRCSVPSPSLCRCPSACLSRPGPSHLLPARPLCLNRAALRVLCSSLQPDCGPPSGCMGGGLCLLPSCPRVGQRHGRCTQFLPVCTHRICRKDGRGEISS